MGAMEYRERARRCRELAANSGIDASHFLAAAVTWDLLAAQADRMAGMLSETPKFA
jgi:hypothetical protein